MANEPVALTRVNLEARAVADNDLAAAVSDELLLLKVTGDRRYAGARDAEHVREKFLCKG